MGTDLAKARKPSCSAGLFKVPFEDQCRCCLPEASKQVTVTLPLQCGTTVLLLLLSCTSLYTQLNCHNDTIQ